MPISPAASLVFTAANVGSNRRWKPIMQVTPARATASAHVLRARDREVDRLFAEDLLAGRRRREDQVGVGVGVRADQHRADRLVGEHLRGRRRLRAVLGGERRRGLAVGVDHVLEPRAGLARDVARVDLADAARPRRVRMSIMFFRLRCRGAGLRRPVRYSMLPEPRRLDGAHRRPPDFAPLR